MLEWDLTIQVEILALLEDLNLAKSEGLFNLLVEEGFSITPSWVNKERKSWRFDWYLCQIFYINLELVCSFYWIPQTTNHITNMLAKWDFLTLNF